MRATILRGGRWWKRVPICISYHTEDDEQERDERRRDEQRDGLSGPKNRRKHQDRKALVRLRAVNVVDIQ